jgi:hypothetical protein
VGTGGRAEPYNRLPGLPMSYSVSEAYDRQRTYLREQLVRALGPDWVEENEELLEEYWEAVVTLGYALPDER